MYRLIRGKRSNGNYSIASKACPLHLKRRTQRNELYFHLGSGSRRQITLFTNKRERVKGELIHAVNRDPVRKYVTGLRCSGNVVMGGEGGVVREEQK